MVYQFNVIVQYYLYPKCDQAYVGTKPGMFTSFTAGLFANTPLQ